MWGKPGAMSTKLKTKKETSKQNKTRQNCSRYKHYSNSAIMFIPCLAFTRKKEHFDNFIRDGNIVTKYLIDHSLKIQLFVLFCAHIITYLLVHIHGKSGVIL